MNIRQAAADDGPAILEVARVSFAESYGFLSEETIDTVSEGGYGSETLEDALTDPDTIFLLAEDDEDVLAFSQSVVIPGDDGAIGELGWLHVRPSARDGGLGSRLLDRTEEVLEEMGTNRIRGVVLSGNESGSSFYRDNGYTEVGRRTVTIGDSEFEEILYRQGDGVAPTPELTETVEAEDGSTLYVADDEADRGSEGPFYPTYRTAEREGRYGLLCGNCRSLHVAMDSMGGAECSNCGNRLQPTRWDAAYL
jgi:ribosomal protein S18 acetylase RimI-like enzyme